MTVGFIAFVVMFTVYVVFVYDKVDDVCDGDLDFMIVCVGVFMVILVFVV